MGRLPHLWIGQPPKARVFQALKLVHALLCAFTSSSIQATRITGSRHRLALSCHCSQAPKSACHLPGCPKPLLNWSRCHDEPSGHVLKLERYRLPLVQKGSPYDLCMCYTIYPWCGLLGPRSKF